MTHKFLTIIIPTCDMEQYLPRCLSSLVINDKDLMELLEILVVIDGGTDKSADIAKGYETQYPETFRVIEKENRHYGSCINRGLKEASGKYIKVLDADDYFDNETFGDFVNILKDADVDLIINYAVTNRKKHNQEYYLGCNPIYFKELEAAGKVFTFEELRSYYKGYIAMHSVTYRTELLREINYTQLEGICYTDNQWVFLPITHVKSIVLFPHILYRYFLGRKGQSVDPDMRRAQFYDVKKINSQLMKEYTEYKGDAFRTNYLKEFIFNRTTGLYAGGLLSTAYNEKDVREYDKELRICYPEIYEKISSYKIPVGCKVFISIGMWRKYDAAWFRFILRCIRFTGRTIRLIIR